MLFINFSPKLSQLLAIDIETSLTLLHSSSCFFSVSLPSLVGTSIKYLFPLLSLRIIGYKGFTILIFEQLKFLTVMYPMKLIRIFLHIFHQSRFYLDQCSLYLPCNWISSMHNFLYLFFFNSLRILKLYYLYQFILICYWCDKMVINVFVLIYISEGNRKY